MLLAECGALLHPVVAASSDHLRVIGRGGGREKAQAVERSLPVAPFPQSRLWSQQTVRLDVTMPDLLDLKAKGIPFTRQHVARLIKQGRFPAPIKLGVGTNRWISSEIDDWIDLRKADRDALLKAREARA